MKNVKTTVPVEISVFISSETPLRVFERYLVPRRPFGVNGLLGYEAVAPAFHALVDSVHPTFHDAVPLIVMVGDLAVVFSTGKYQRRGALKKNNAGTEVQTIKSSHLQWLSSIIPKTWMLSHTSIAKIMVKNPVLRNAPVFILKEKRSGQLLRER